MPAELPELPGVLTGDDVRATVASIAAEQSGDGALPWFRGGQLDAWDSVEAAMALDLGGAHALHAPFWWLKCALGVDRDTAAVRAYHRLLVWDLVHRPWLTRTAERVLDPLFGKSLVVYADKPAAVRPVRNPGAGGGASAEWERTAAAR